MTRLEQLRRYATTLQEYLALRDLTVKVDDNPSPEDTYADILVHDEAPEATIRVAPEFWRQSAEDQRRIVVHELVHCHLAAMVNLKDDLEKQLGTAAFAIYDAAFERAHERATDKIARLLADTVPLPPKFSKT